MTPDGAQLSYVRPRVRSRGGLSCRGARPADQAHDRYDARYQRQDNQHTDHIMNDLRIDPVGDLAAVVRSEQGLDAESEKTADAKRDEERRPVNAESARREHER